MKYLCTGAVFSLLISCAGVMPLHMSANKNDLFIPSKNIYVQTGEEIVELSLRLKSFMIRRGFNITDRRQDAEYILTLNYSARFDVYPWVFRSFNLDIADVDTGTVHYFVRSGSSHAEAVDSVMKRVVDDMAEKLIRSRGNPHLTIDSTGL